MDRRRRISTTIAVAVVLMTACTGNGDVDVSVSPSAEPAVPRGGTLQLGLLYWAYPEDARLLDPQQPYGIWSETEMLRCCLLRTLYSYNGLPTEQGGAEARPDLATGQPTVSADGLTWTFHIQHGLHYGPPLQDVEITTPDIVRALERAAVPGQTAAYASYYGPIRPAAHPFDFDFGMIQGFGEYERGASDRIFGLETPDPYTLVVRLDEVTNDLIHRFAFPPTAPLPPNPADPAARYGVAEGHDSDYGQYLVSSGPYMIEGAPSLDFSVPASEQAPLSGIDADGITLVRNPSWDPATDGLHGDHVDGMRFDKVSSVAQADRMIEAGTLDVLFDSANAPEFRRRFEQDASLSDRVFVHTGPPLFWLAMNLAMPPFDDVNVRKAMNYSIDRDAAAETFSSGLIAGAYTRYLAYSHIAPDGAENGLNRDYNPYPYDLQQARSWMRRATAYDTDGDGRCDVPACRNVLAIDVDYPVTRRGDAVLARGLRAIGVDLELRFLTFNRMDALSRDPRAHIALNLVAYTYQSYPNATPLFMSQFTGGGIGTPLSPAATSNETLMGARPAQLRRWGYDVLEVPNVDANVAACAAKLGLDQTQCWASLDRYLMERIVPVIPFYTATISGVVSERVVRYGIDAASYFPSPDQFALAPGSD